MEREEIATEMECYPKRTIFDITWDRGNGDLSAQYILLGFKGDTPILKRYEEGKDLSSYSESPSFDIFNEAIHVKNIEVLLGGLEPLF